MIKIPKDDPFLGPKRVMLRYLRTMQCDNFDRTTWNPRKDRSICRIENFVLKHGSFFTPKALIGVHMGAMEGEPVDCKPGFPSRCYYNALNLVLNDARLTYAEGFAFTSESYGRGHGPTWHVWAVNSANEAIDNTWFEPGLVYFGVPFRGEWLMDLAIKYYKNLCLHWRSVCYRFRKKLLGALGDHPEKWKSTPGDVTNEHANLDRLILGQFPFTAQLRMLAKQGWNGKAAELLPLLLGMAQRRGNNLVPGARETPQTPQMLVKELKWLAPRLERAGIVVENDSRHHCWSIRRTGAPAC